MAQQSNFQDIVVLSSNRLTAGVEALIVGTDAGSKSLVFAQDPAQASALFVIASNATAQLTQILQNANGTVGLITAISAGTTLQSNGQIVLLNSNGISFGMNGSTVTAKGPTLSYFVPGNQQPVAANAVVTASGTSNLSFQRISVPCQVNATELDFLAVLTVAGSTAGSMTLSIAAYTFATSTASSASSTSVAYTWNSGTATSGAATNYGGLSGTRWLSVPMATWNLTPGDYLIGAIVSIAGVAGTTGSMTLYGGSSISLNSAILATGNLSRYFADGLFSAGTGGFPSSVHLSAINQSGASVLAQPYFRILGT